MQEKNGVKYSFVEFSDDESVLFACEMMDGTELYSKAIVVKPRSKTNNEKIWDEKKRLDLVYFAEITTSPLNFNESFHLHLISVISIWNIKL